MDSRAFRFNVGSIRVAEPQQDRALASERGHYYAAKRCSRNERIFQIGIGIAASSAAQLRVTIQTALNPQHEEFEPRTMWSLSNAFTSAFKELDPIPQFKATAKLGGFLEPRASESF